MWTGVRKEIYALDLLDKLKGLNNNGDLLLSEVYHEIVAGMLLCLPNSWKLLRADVNPGQFEMLVRRLKLSDLFSEGGGLQKYLSNLSRSVMGDIKQCCDHCVPEKKEIEEFLPKSTKVSKIHRFSLHMLVEFWSERSEDRQKVEEEEGKREEEGERGRGR